MNISLQSEGFIELPPHINQGGFDHAAVSLSQKKLYVAHTANDAVDIIDTTNDRYLRSLSGLNGVAGALVSDERNLLFASNRGENTVSIFDLKTEKELKRINVGIRPNGLAFDLERNLLLSGNVGLPNEPSTYSLSLIDVGTGEVVKTFSTPGRSRWMVYDPKAQAFYVNIGKPAKIAVIQANDYKADPNWINIDAEGPHGLDIDIKTGRLFCACDDKTLITIDLQTKREIFRSTLSGPPDVIFFNAQLDRLYVAIGNPGVIDVFDTKSMTKSESMKTENGAHTIGFSSIDQKVYAFLPESHRAAIYSDKLKFKEILL